MSRHIATQIADREVPLTGERVNTQISPHKLGLVLAAFIGISSGRRSSWWDGRSR